MNIPTKKKRGRPLGSKSDNPSDKQLPRIRVTESQLTAYKIASKRSGQTLSAWARAALDQAAKN